MDIILSGKYLLHVVRTLYDDSNQTDIGQVVIVLIRYTCSDHTDYLIRTHPEGGLA